MNNSQREIKKIIRLYAYYEPEIIASTHLVSDLEKTLVHNSYEIDCITPVPSRGVDREVQQKYKSRKYEEKENGKIRVHRINIFPETHNVVKRTIRYLLLNIKQYIEAKKISDANLILTGSTPPTQGLVGALLSKRKKIPMVYILQDMFPESLVTTGLTHANSFVYKIGIKMEQYVYSNSNKIIVICDEFKKNLISKGVSPEKIEVIYNWIDTNKIRPVSRDKNMLFKEYNLDKQDFYVTYAGNMGNAQDLDTILNVAKELENYKDIKFILFGSGKGKEYCESIVKSRNLVNTTILPLQSQNKISEVYSLGNVSIVSCKKGMGKTALPSKTWSIMASATAIVTNFDINSDLTEIILKSNSGIANDSGDVCSIKKSILKLYYNRDLCNEMGVNGRNFVINNMNTEICTREYVRVLDDLIHKSTEVEK